MPDILHLQRRAHVIFWGMLRSIIYIAIFISWGFSVKRRIVAPKPRMCLIMVAVLLVLWVYLRTVKYFFVTDADIRRILWYLYYFPMLYIPFLAVCESALLGKPEYFELPKWLFLPLVVTTGLFLFVLTNDFHQLVFQFPQDALEHTDADFSYGIGYYPVLCWEILCAIYSVAVMISKCRIPGEKRIRLLPFVPIAFSTLYAIIFIKRIPILSLLTRDVTIFQCLFFMLSFECCIRCDLIQSNSNYYQFFTQSKLPLMITDKNYQIYMKSHNMKMPKLSEMKQSEHSLVKLSDQHNLLQYEIAGGRVLWKEDTSKIEKAMEQLKELNESLEELYEMKAEQVRTQRKKEQLEEINRIYGQMQKQTEKQLLLMEDLLDKLSESRNVNCDKELVWRLSVIGAYIKRRNNLLFLSETQNMIDERELDYCFQESIQALKCNGILGTYLFDVEKELSFPIMVALYDAFEYILELVFDDLKKIDLIVKDNNHHVLLQMSLLLKTKCLDELPSSFLIESQSEGSYDVIFQV